MKKYLVSVGYIVDDTFEIEAESAEAACKEAVERFETLDADDADYASNCSHSTEVFSIEETKEEGS